MFSRKQTENAPAPSAAEGAGSSRPLARGPRAWIAALVLRVSGWSAEGGAPIEPKYVLIAAPHTTNWDFFYLFTMAWWWGMRISWLGKQSLFGPPFGWFFRLMDGIPVDRGSHQDLVGQLSRVFRERERLVLVIPAEGTRDFRDHWKSGFYFVARDAGVPIRLGFLDYERKVGGIGPRIDPSDDLTRDMDQIRAFYRDIRGKYPEQFSTIRLLQEDEPIQASKG